MAVKFVRMDLERIGVDYTRGITQYPPPPPPPTPPRRISQKIQNASG